MYLTNGKSNQRGVCLTARTGKQTVSAYAYRCEGGIKCLVGDNQVVDALFKKHRNANAREKSSSDRNVVLMFLVPVVLIVAAFVFAQNAYQVAGVALAAVVGAFPAFALSLIGGDSFDDDALYQQLRRNHGAEHMLFAYIRKHPMKKTPQVMVEDLEGYSYVDPECGTVWASTAVIWAVALGLSVALVPWWGAGASLKALAAFTALLVANIYLNPKNPLKHFQGPEVAQPTLEELELAVEAYNQLRAAFPEEDRENVKQDEPL